MEHSDIQGKSKCYVQCSNGKWKETRMSFDCHHLFSWRLHEEPLRKSKTQDYSEHFVDRDRHWYVILGQSIWNQRIGIYLCYVQSRRLERN